MLQIAATLHRQGKLGEAQAVYEAVLAREPDNYDATQLLGLVALHTGRPDRALRLMSTAMALQPGVAGLHRNRAVALKALGRLEDAAEDYDAAIALQPEFPMTHFHRAGVLTSLGRLEDAVADYDIALARAPEHAEANLDRGLALAGLGRLDEALAAYDAAIALSPGLAAAHFNRGNLLRQLGRVDEAVECYARAIAQQPDFAIAHHNQAVCLLQLGRMDEGLRGYEWRKRAPDFEHRRYELAPAWTGAEPVTGLTVFIYPELYLGDMIQMCRYAPKIERLGARVVLGAPASLHGLLRGLSPTTELVASGGIPGRFDLQCALMSLPLAFHDRGEAIPAEVPYLRAEPARVERWKATIGEDGFKVGVCWQGSTLPYAFPMQRSFPLAALAGIARLPGVRLISLQKHDGLEQLGSLPAGMAVETLGEDFDAGPDGFLDTAAAMQSCDLMLSADTAVAHLAGALGLRTFVALPHVADWRWRLGCEDSPWYPTMRLVRQGAPGDWAGVFAAIEAEISRMTDA